MKLYTGIGDKGNTQLFGGQHVAKDDLRVEAYGSVDELNSVLGLAASSCEHQELKGILLDLQSRCFDVGADLATPRDATAPAAMKVRRVDEAWFTEAEKLIDEVSAKLEPLSYFILPGGCELAARLHIARTTCRRAERRIVALKAHADIGEALPIYMNRISDLLFALARWANQLEGVEDVPWQPKQ